MGMANLSTAEQLVPERPTLAKLKKAAAGCTACPLYENATQTVFGEGPKGAAIVLVGEQPGDREDREGHPFVGPAGAILDRALQEAGVDRDQVYVTNTVKHFKWEPRGKRRLHKKPNAREIAACDPWFRAELKVLAPEVVVALGATAAQAMMGRDFRVTRQRGELMEVSFAPRFLATWHPSSILRARGDDRELRFQELVSDLGRLKEVKGVSGK